MKNEKQIRKEIIDNRLKEAGWKLTDRTQIIEEFDIVVDQTLAKESLTSYTGLLFKDYVLLEPDVQPLAFVEAKKHRDMQPSGVNIKPSH